MHIPLLPDIIIILGLAIAVQLLTTRIKIPPIIGFLITGFIAGPYGLGLVTEIGQVEMLAEVGVILLLFTIGIEFSLSDLVKIRKIVLIGGGFQVFATIAAIWFIGRQFGFSDPFSLTMGILAATSSTAILLKSLQERNEINSSHGRNALGVLIFQDIIVVPLMLIIPFLAGGEGDIGSSLLLLLMKGIGIVTVALLAAKYVMPYVLFQVARSRSRELFILSIVAICFVIAGATAELGLSLGLGAFLAGLVISESEYSHQAMAGVLPLKDLFTSIFFVSIGMLLDMGFVFANPLWVLTTTISVLAIKSIIIVVMGFLLQQPIRTIITTAIILSQIGEFGFVLASVAFSESLLSAEHYQLFLATAVITMMITPILLSFGPSIGRNLGTKLKSIDSKRSQGNLNDIEKSELRDHLIIVGYGVNGKNLSRAARYGSIPYIILEMNPDTVKDERAKGEPIHFGDATHEPVLEFVGVDRARVMVIAISDPIASRTIAAIVKERNPGIYLIVRTRLISELNPLYKLGADEVIPEEFETSIEIFTRVLYKYLIPRQEIEKLTEDIRSSRYEMLRTPRARGKITDLHRYFDDMEITTVNLPEHSWMAGKTLMDLDLRKEMGITLLATREDSKVEPNPPANHPLKAGSDLIIMGSCESVRDFLSSIDETNRA
jgi:monovalent cation:H+ antiporter-2, CPA2 family